MLSKWHWVLISLYKWKTTWKKPQRVVFEWIWTQVTTGLLVHSGFQILTMGQQGPNPSSLPRSHTWFLFVSTGKKQKEKSPAPVTYGRVSNTSGFPILSSFALDCNNTLTSGEHQVAPTIHRFLSVCEVEMCAKFKVRSQICTQNLGSKRKQIVPLQEKFPKCLATISAKPHSGHLNTTMLRRLYKLATFQLRGADVFTLQPLN